jgi:hypothetical protein
MLKSNDDGYKQDDTLGREGYACLFLDAIFGVVLLVQ